VREFEIDLFSKVRNSIAIGTAKYGDVVENKTS
jgi:hypothetical protein